MTGALEGTRSFVTGGGSGIGRASAIALAAQGSFVTVAGRTESTLAETVALIEKEGGRAAAVACDVTNEESVRRAVEVAAGPAGRLGFAVNSARVSGGDDLRPLADPEGNLIELVSPIQ